MWPRNRRLRRPGSTVAYVLVGLLLATTLIVGAVAVLQIDLSGDQGNRLPRRAEYDIAAQKQIDPALIGYEQTASFAAGLENASLVTFDGEGTLWIAGEKEVAQVTSQGAVSHRFSVAAAPRCLAVHDGVVYVGCDDRVETFSSKGESAGSWPSLGERARITDIAVAEDRVFVADAGNKVIHRYTPRGDYLGRIGDRRDNPRVPGFVIPSPCFPLLFGDEGLLWVSNPGRHRVEAYTPEGDWEEPLSWGCAAMLSKPRIAGFEGCCNPARLRRLPDGGFVTVEKGVIQIKEFDRDGKFRCVVSGPAPFSRSSTHMEDARTDHKPKMIDLAVDGEGHVWVLDPNSESIRVFKKK